MKIIVLNCGSSSIKYQLLDIQPKTEVELLAKGLIERIGLNEGILTHSPAGKNEYTTTQSIPDHTVGINLILKALTDAEHGVINSLEEIAAAGHRVAHGGEFFKDSAIVTPLVKQQIESCFELAPLHNPASLKGILSIERLLPSIQQVAVFDTSFHQTMEPAQYLYPLPYKYYTDLHIRRYGFHGTSHKFVAQKACEMTGLDFPTAKIITCHIGNGASITAIKNGESIDTSMGFTPVDGLMMGTRCGSVDPGALLYIMDKEGISPSKMTEIINKESGLTGVSGVSSDMRDLLKAMNNGNLQAQYALDIFDMRIKKTIGGYFAELEGADLIVFTGGIGENGRITRRKALTGLQCMGIEIDLDINEQTMGVDAILSTNNSKVKVVVATTNEELVIASDTFRLLRNCE